MPPAAGLGFPGQAHEGFGGGGVDLAHGFDIEAAQAGLAGFDAPDLGFGPFQFLGGYLDGQPLLAAELAQVPSELRQEGFPNLPSTPLNAARGG